MERPLYAFAVITVLAALLSAQAPDAIGVVGGYAPSEARYHFSRSSSDSALVRIGSLVYLNDAVTFAGSGSITIDLADGRTVRLNGPGRMVVPQSRRLGVLAQFLRIADLFDSHYRRTQTAAVRGAGDCVPGSPGAPIEVPMFGDRSRVLAGERDVPVVWLGGCAPFDVAVRTGTTTIRSQTALTDRQVRLRALPLARGRHELVVRDRHGREAIATIDAVAALPVLPPELTGDSTSPLGTVALAMWLGDVDGGVWRFEAFEVLRPLLRRQHPLAGVLADGFLFVRRPASKDP